VEGGPEEEAAGGGPEEEAARGGPEEEAASWVETAFPNNVKDFSQITYQKQQKQHSNKKSVFSLDFGPI